MKEAFAQLVEHGGPVHPSSTGDVFFTGMSVRDYFAAQAMQSLIAGLSREEIDQMLSGVLGCKRVAGAAFMCADAMLRARASQGEA